MLCIDQNDETQVKIQGGRFDLQFTRTYISVDIKEEFCRNDPGDLECVTSREFDEELKNKVFVTLSN